MTLALIDGDIVAYRAAAAAQSAIDWGDGDVVTRTDAPAAAQNAVSIVRTWVGMARADRAWVCFSDPEHNFRRQLGPYKESRGEKPLAYWDCVKALKDEWPERMLPTLEADDVMGILQTSERTGDTVIVSIDKDMQTIPGQLLNPLKHKRPRKVSLSAADRYWMLQTLTGDVVDGYSGVRGIGPKKAEKILAACAQRLPSWWVAVVETYLAAGLTEADALMNARFARILRRDDWDKETQEVLLWSPSKSRPRLSTNTAVLAKLA